MDDFPCICRFRGKLGAVPGDARADRAIGIERQSSFRTLDDLPLLAWSSARFCKPGMKLGILVCFSCKVLKEWQGLFEFVLAKQR